MAIKTVEEAFAGLIKGDRHLDFVKPQIEQSNSAMQTIHLLAAKVVQGGAIRQSDLLSAIGSALSIGVQIGLEMSGTFTPIVGPGGTAIQ